MPPNAIIFHRLNKKKNAIDSHHFPLLLEIDGIWWHYMPLISSNVFQYSTVMAIGEKSYHCFPVAVENGGKNASSIFNGNWWHLMAIGGI